MPRPFRFHEVWLLPSDADTVYRALAAPEHYRDWWPQILTSRTLDAESGVLTCRSALPYTLALTITRHTQDEIGRYLRAGISGDLVGWSSWQVEPDPAGGCRAVYDQEVVVAGRFLGVAARLARPVLRWNHHAMMAGGERGLHRWLRLRDEPTLTTVDRLTTRLEEQPVTSTTVLHLAHVDEWAAAQLSGEFDRSTRGLSLAQVGFIHRSTAAQLAATAETFYADEPGPLLVLVIDVDAVEAAGSPVRWEPSGGQDFPHIYGPVPVSAVLAAHPAGFDADGRFESSALT